MTTECMNIWWFFNNNASWIIVGLFFVCCAIPASISAWRGDPKD
jgi:hypothetical protein